jgi:hypothetical protein
MLVQDQEEVCTLTYGTLSSFLPLRVLCMPCLSFRWNPRWKGGRKGGLRRNGSLEPPLQPP